MYVKSIVIACAATATLAGCVDRSAYESLPVRLTTPEGVVTCQLYTNERVLWDRAIAAPEAMSAEAANEICIEEGQRRLDVAKAAGEADVTDDADLTVDGDLTESAVWEEDTDLFGDGEEAAEAVEADEG